MFLTRIKGIPFLLFALTFLLWAPSAGAQRVWPVDISGREYVPQELTLWSGDSIRFCNQGPWRRQPYSTHKPNRFGERKAQTHEMLKKGECESVEIRNPTNRWLKFTIRDAVVPEVRLKVKVNPARP